MRTLALREFLHDSTEFEWTERNETEWRVLKTTFTTIPILAYYDPPKKTEDFHITMKDELGAFLLQAEGDSWKPMTYASRSMTKTETRYAQIRKESLGLTYGLEIFYCYVYGLPTFTVEVDRHSLVLNIKKNMNEMSSRIHRLVMKSK